jgi:hypothetical protein
VRRAYRSRCPTINDEVNSVGGCLKMAADFLLNRGGALTMAPTPVAAFAMTKEEDDEMEVRFSSDDAEPSSSDDAEPSSSDDAERRPDVQVMKVVTYR